MRAAIVLAAGSSRRWGAENKLMARIGGRPLVCHAVAAARQAPVGRILVVTGRQSGRVAAAVRGPRVTVVRARDHATGLSASVRAGLAALRPCETSVFIFLGDMPRVPPFLAERLARALRIRDSGVRPTSRGVPGHPVLLRRPDRTELAQLHGDRGLAPLLRGLRTIPGPRSAIIDIDRRTDRAKLR
ncbi:nucleotidyltransferase family protein [Sphingomonas jatrophae]|uniref:Molybdenum cofactor cytidylyltransferase n=1 Tax=Sphingomonas jatrophae TaxID=1166337 RepID=A0A1I6JKU3_9SPHN|nr:nucleotidyltransferase family protein [Sphingomonas jatrophae]SFR79606.1 molybdenum cofactor cytidylyltransferase [Sphingomonas jatrophae]